MDAPKLLTKEAENINAVDLINYLDNTPAADILADLMPNFPANYLSTINDIYANIILPRGVLNCMIIKVLKEKSGELPPLAYFKKVSETWISNNVFTTIDAIKFSTNYEADNSKKKVQNSKYTAGSGETL